MLARLAALVLALPILSAACASTTPPAETPKGGGEAQKPAEKASPNKKPLAEHRADFMNGCNTKVPNATAYCECGWEQMQKVFTEDEMNSDAEADKGKLAQLKEQVEATCRSKLPEDFIKGGFVKSCTGEVAKLGPYCECSWTEYRKKFSAAELADDGIIKTERFNTTKKDAVKVCGTKMPEDIPHQAFITACAQNPAMEKYCECAWKTVRAERSAAEIEAGLVDLDATKPKVEKSCKAFKPAK